MSEDRVSFNERAKSLVERSAKARSEYHEKAKEKAAKGGGPTLKDLGLDDQKAVGKIVRFRDGGLACIVRIDGPDLFTLMDEKGGGFYTPGFPNHAVHAVSEDFEVLDPQPKEWTPLGDRLPYGIWFCADGREVLFNRHYKPIWERTGKFVEPAKADEWVEFVFQGWFYNDRSRPYRYPKQVSVIEAVLRDFQAGRSVINRLINYRVAK
jgi:hypothetical protein